MLLLSALVLARTVRQSARNPALNWDMLAYMALAASWELDPTEAHRVTYASARAELDPAVYRELTAPGVREERARDPLAFHEHLAFYRARILYTLPVYLLWKSGAPLTAATWWVSLAAYAGCACLFALWASRYLPPWLAALFALGLAHAPAFLTLAAYSTADGVATFLITAAAYLLVERRSFAAGAPLFLLAILARPDAVILVGFLALALFLFDESPARPRLPWLAGWVVAAVVLTFAAQRFAGEYGWWPLFTISFDEKVLHPAELPTAVDWAQYRAVLGERIAALPGDGYFATARSVTGSSLAFLFAVLAVLGLALWRTRARESGREAALLAALLATYLLRFFLFPQLWDRFFAPFYALVPLCLLALVVRALRGPADPSVSRC